MRRVYIRLLLLVIILLGWGLRLWRLDDQELRGDEVFGYFFSLRPLHELVPATVELQEPHPIASYIIQHHWLAWAGHSEFALRFTSAWFGILAVALLWSLARALTLAPATALLGTLLLAGSPYAIWHSQDARMYSMSLTLTTASTWFMSAWLQRQRRVWAIAYVVSSWSALHTHYFSAFVLVAQNLFVLIRALQQPRLRFTFINWLSLQATIAFFYGPWLLRVQTTLSNYHGNGDSPAIGEMLQRAGRVFLVGESVPMAQHLWWALLAGLLLLWGTVALARTGANGQRTLLLLGLYLGVPLLATWWSATQRPIFNERYLVAAAPPFALLVAAGLAHGWFAAFRRFQPAADNQSTLKRTGRASGHENLFFDRRPGIIYAMWVVLLLVALSGMGLALTRYYTDPAYSKTRGWRALATTLTQWSAQLPADKVRIAQNFPDPTLWYYYRGPVAHVVLPPAAQDEAGAQATVAHLHQSGVQRVLLPVQPALNWDNRSIAAAALGMTYTIAYATTVGVWPVQVYVAPPTTLHTTTVTFTNGVALTGFAAEPTTLSPANLLTVHLGWRGDQAKLTGSEKVFVQVLNGGGQLVAQDDRPLQVAETPMVVTINTYGILLPDPLAAGDYQLLVGLYDPTSAGMPRILTTDGRDALPLLAMPSMPLGVPTEKQ